MKRSISSTLLATLAGLLLLTTALSAQGNFVYINNDAPGANSVSVFAVGANGVLTPVSGSPFSTGGSGQGGGFFATNLITTSPSGNFLFASNGGTNNISAFSINPTTGVLTAVPGSPFVTGGVSGFGISLSISPNGQFLFAGNDGTQNISVFTVAGNGALSPILGSPFSSAGGSIDGTAVSPDGKFLAVARLGSIHVFSIGASGALSTVPGSPFASAGGTAGIKFNSTGTLLFAGDAVGSSTHVEIFKVASNGSLTNILGSPFTFVSGSNSNVVLPSPDNRFLFVANQATATVTVLSLAPNGTPTLVPGSPFSTGTGGFSDGMSTDPLGRFLFVANGNGTVTAFSIATNGTLTLVPGSPFSNPPEFRSGPTGFPSTPIFNICLADAAGNRLLFDSVRGFYELRNCNTAVTAFGQGTAINQGCNVVFFDLKPDRAVKGSVNTCGQPGVGVFIGIPTGSGTVMVSSPALPITSCGCP